jgi:GT2 family glycosyltransferase
MIKLTCIVPVFGREELTKNFIDSFVEAKKCIKDLMYIDLIIIDDHPDITTINKLGGGEYNDNVKFIRSSGDVWWCKTVNVGINYLSENNNIDYIAIANNDIILPKDFFCKLYNVIKMYPLNALHPETCDMKNMNIQYSSGAKLISWFPFITKHPFKIPENSVTKIDLATARFLVVPYKKIYEVNGISNNLIQYQGDNDLSLKLKKVGCSTLIFSHSCCYLYNEDTGLKNDNISSIRSFFRSLMEIRSANYLKNRMSFLNNHHSILISSLILVSMTLNSFVKVLRNKLTNK